MSSNIVKDPYLLLGDLATEIYYIRENDLKFGNPFSDEYKEVIVKYNKLCEELRLLDESLEWDGDVNMDNTERNLHNALDASKRRLQKLEDEYKDAITKPIMEQYKDYLEEDIEIEKANIAVLEGKLEEIRMDKIKERLDEYKKFKQEKWLQENKVNISFNNFEYALLLLLDNLHSENMCILHYLLKKEEANKVQEVSEDNINKVFKNYLAIKRG